MSNPFNNAFANQLKKLKKGFAKGTQDKNISTSNQTSNSNNTAQQVSKQPKTKQSNIKLSKEDELLAQAMQSAGIQEDITAPPKKEFTPQKRDAEIFEDDIAVEQQTKHYATEDERLFAEAMSGITPIKSNNRVSADALKATKVHKKPSASTLAKRAAAQGEDETSNLDVAISDMQALLNPVAEHSVLSFKKTGVQNHIFAKLKAGKLRWYEGVDLHGSTVEEAREAVMQVIAMTQQNGETVLKIVHGKGKDAIIKSHVNSWLKQHPQVLAFCSAPNSDGGTGAVLVMIKRHSTEK